MAEMDKIFLNARHIFKGKLLNVYLKKHKYPNGYVGRLEIVKHLGAVLIVPLLKNNVVLIRQYRPVINSFIWELPAGTLKKNEKPLSCAKRELIEEIGYTAKKWKRRGYMYPAPGYTTEKIIVFEADDLEKTYFESEEDEIIKPKIFSRIDIKRLLKSGRIVDAKTICALKLSNII